MMDTSTPDAPSLRDDHMAHTRQRLLMAAEDLLVDDGVDEFSLREVAKRAGVSAPTAYRHFPTKEAMFEAVLPFLEERMGVPQAINTIEEFIAALPSIHLGFQKQAKTMTAYVRARSARELRNAGRERRRRRVEAAVKASLPALAGESQVAFCAVMQLFSSSAGWDLWRDVWGLEGERAGHVARWAVKALYDAHRKNPKALTAALKNPRPSKGAAS
jgi:AcrR family transcriptional regulator